MEEDELYTVTVDVDALQARLKWSDGKPANRADTLWWLKSCGFAETRWPGVFVGNRAAVAALAENEVVSAKPFGA